MTPAFRRKVEKAAKKAGWDDLYPQADGETCGYYWNMEPFSMVPHETHTESLSTRTKERCYLLAARLLGVRPSKGKGGK